MNAKLQRAAAWAYPITVLILAVPILWIAYKNRKERLNELSIIKDAGLTGRMSKNDQTATA